MSKKRVELRYKWDLDNANRLFNASYKYIFNNSSKRYIGWFFIALSQYAIVVALKKDAFALLLFSTIVLTYWYYGKKIIAKKRALNFFQKSSFKDKELKIEATKEGLKIDSINQDFWSWNDIDEVISIGDDILIFKNPNFHYIPSSAFTSIEDKSQFKSFSSNIKSKVTT